jgi:hypothetical protein
MAAIAITRLQADPADAEHLRACHGALVVTTQANVPGLTEAELGRIGGQWWVGVRRWESAGSARFLPHQPP